MAKDPAQVAAGRRARKIGAAAQAREAEWWERQGFLVEGNFKRARYLGPGRLITIPHDLFADTKTGQAGFDHIAIRPGRPVLFVGIQTTVEPFESNGRADRNARHGPPPFGWPPPSTTVEEWVAEAQDGGDRILPAMVQVIVSYADRRHPERRWWIRDEEKEGKGLATGG